MPACLCLVPQATSTGFVDPSSCRFQGCSDSTPSSLVVPPGFRAPDCPGRQLFPSSW